MTRIPHSSAALNAQQTRLEAALLQKQTGAKVRESARTETVKEIEQTADAKTEKAEKEFEAEDGINLFAAVGFVAAAVCTAGAAASVAGGMLAIGGLGAVLTAAVTVAVPALVCGTVASLIARGIGTAIYTSEKDEAKELQADAENLDIARKQNMDLTKRAGTRNLEAGREEAKNASQAIFTMLNTKE